MKKNVGSIDALIRITVGLFGLAWGISRAAKSRGHKLPLLITFLSAMKVAEGVVRFCPGLALFRVDTMNTNEQQRKAPYSTQFYARRKISSTASSDERGGDSID